MSEDAAALQERFTEVKNEIAARCNEDSDFREALVKDANGTIEEEYGLEKGSLAQFEMQVITEEGNKIIIVIPPDFSEMELSDDELDQVAGGAVFTLVVGPLVKVIAAAVIGVVSGSTREGRKW